MNRTLLPLALASMVATGCSFPAFTAPAASAARVTVEKATEANSTDVASDTAGAAEVDSGTQGGLVAAEATSGRKPGDFIVYRFSGSFRKAPLTLTQRVLDKQGAVLTVEVIAEEGSSKRELRVKIDEASAAKNEVVSAVWVEGGVEKPAPVEAYETLLAEATLAADENEAFLGEENVVLDVGGAPLPCRKASFRVRVGKKQATLRTIESDGFAWGDLGGDLTTAGGKVLYRAEVVEMGHVELAKGTAVAHSDRDH